MCRRLSTRRANQLGQPTNPGGHGGHRHSRRWHRQWSVRLHFRRFWRRAQCQQVDWHGSSRRRDRNRLRCGSHLTAFCLALLLNARLLPSLTIFLFQISFRTSQTSGASSAASVAVSSSPAPATAPSFGGFGSPAPAAAAAAPAPAFESPFAAASPNATAAPSFFGSAGVAAPQFAVGTRVRALRDIPPGLAPAFFVIIAAPISCLDLATILTFSHALLSRSRFAFPVTCQLRASLLLPIWPFRRALSAPSLGSNRAVIFASILAPH